MVPPCLTRDDTDPTAGRPGAQRSRPEPPSRVAAAYGQAHDDARSRMTHPRGRGAPTSPVVSQP